MNMRKAVAALLAATMLCAASGCRPTGGGSQYPTPENPKTIKWGLSISTSSIIYQKALQVKEEVESSTNGAIKLELYPSSQLGDENTMLDGILSGTVDMANISTNTVSTVISDFNAFTLPFVFENTETFWNVARDSEFRAKITEMSSQHGIAFLGMLAMFNRGINTKTPVTIPDDLSGMKLRLMPGHTFTDMFTSWNAGTIIMPFNEVYTALQQNVIDGLCCPVDGCIDQKFFEVAPYYVDTNHTYHFTASLMNKNTWDSLSSDQQTAIANAFDKVTENSVEEYYQIRDQLIQKAKDEFGTVFTHLTDEQRAMWIKDVEWMYDGYQYVDADFLTWFLQFIQDHKLKSDRF